MGSGLQSSGGKRRVCDFFNAGSVQAQIVNALATTVECAGWLLEI